MVKCLHPHIHSRIRVKLVCPIKYIISIVLAEYEERASSMWLWWSFNQTYFITGVKRVCVRVLGKRLQHILNDVQILSFALYPLIWTEQLPCGWSCKGQCGLYEGIWWSRVVWRLAYTFTTVHAGLSWLGTGILTGSYIPAYPSFPLLFPSYPLLWPLHSPVPG